MDQSAATLVKTDPTSGNVSDAMKPAVAWLIILDCCTPSKRCYVCAGTRPTFCESCLAPETRTASYAAAGAELLLLASVLHAASNHPRSAAARLVSPPHTRYRK